MSLSYLVEEYINVIFVPPCLILCCVLYLLHDVVLSALPPPTFNLFKIYIIFAFRAQPSIILHYWSMVWRRVGVGGGGRGYPIFFKYSTQIFSLKEKQQLSIALNSYFLLPISTHSEGVKLNYMIQENSKCKISQVYDTGLQR